MDEGTQKVFIDIIKAQQHQPLPLSSRSDRVCAPDLDLAGSDSNSLLNLGWNRGMHRKSNLTTQDTKHSLLTLFYCGTSTRGTPSFSFCGAMFKITHFI